MNRGLKDMKSEGCIIGFQGVEGSFSHQALIEYFGEHRKTFALEKFQDVFEAIENEKISYGVLPIENSSTGGIAEVYDLLYKYGFYIVGEKCIKVDHNLIGIKGTHINDIKEVYSHEQGFLQCREYLDGHDKWTLIPYFNTARSAKLIHDENIKSKGCIASKKAADLYGLEIIDSNINYNKNNITRFIIVSKTKEVTENCDKISIVLSLPHKTGSLYKALRYFEENNCNMLKIESRPMVGKSWEYIFYIDFHGNLNEENSKNLINDIEKESLYFKFLGNYKGEVS